MVSLMDQIEKSEVKSVYIHIPFCKRICSYCDFCKNFYNEKLVSNYLDALKKEININYKNEILDTLYIGGGTPSSLSIKNLTKLFKTLGVFNLDDDYEFTFECNYEDITEELLVILKNGRINRLSIGIETFNEKYAKVLNRNINKDNIKEKIILAKKYFSNINIDLIYALPNETLKDLKKDLEEFIKLDVNHISTYSLIIEEHTRLKLTKIKEINDDLQNKMYYSILKKLKKHGYNHYELSNFSKEGYESKHNLTYWNNEEYYGFGAGASGFVNKIRYDNTKSVFNYLKGKTIIYKEYINNDQMLKDEVMLNLRKITGINKKLFLDKYDLEFDKIFNCSILIKNDFLKDDGKNIYIPQNKLFLSNQIIIEVLESYVLEQ